MKIFMTGVTGLLGSYIARHLVESGHLIYILARPKNRVSSEERVINAIRSTLGKKKCKFDMKKKILISPSVI